MKCLRLGVALVTTAVTGACFAAPQAAVRADEILVSRHDAGTVERWQAKDGVWKKTGDFIPAGTISPIGLAYANGIVYVADAPKDAKGGRIMKYAPDGRCLGEFVKMDKTPEHLLATDDGVLLVSSYRHWKLCCYRLSNGRGGEIVGLSTPRMLAFGPDGGLYICCRSYGRIEIINYRGGNNHGLLGTYATPGGNGALAFGGADWSKLIVPGQKTEAMDLKTGKLITYPDSVRFADCQAAVRIGGEVYAADARGGFIARIPAEPGPMTKVAEKVPGIVALFNLTAAMSGADAKERQAAAKRTDAPKTFVREGPVMPPGYDFERLKFNNPGLTVELALGVWPRPTVFDWSPNGGNDIAIAYGSAPSARECLFRNSTPRGVKNPLPVFKTPVVGRHPRAREVKPHPPYQLPVGRWFYGDLNGDGREDALGYCSDASGYGPPGPACPVAYRGETWTNTQYLAFFHWRENLGGTGDKTQWGPTQDILIGGEKFPVPGPYGVSAACFQDWDGDGDIDFVVTDQISQFWFFENRGTRTQPRFDSAQRMLSSEGRLLQGELCGGGAKFIDWDGDGLLDVILWEECGRVFYSHNAGRLDGHVPQFDPFVCFRQEADDLKFRDIPTPQGVDWDGDGDWDLVTGDVGGYIAFIENLSGPGVEKPKWAEPKCLSVIDPEKSAYRWTDGHYIHASCGIENSPQGPMEQKFGYPQPYVADWDGDGYLDVLANDVKGSVVWFRNPGVKGTTQLCAAQPIEVEWDGPQPQASWEWRRPPKGKALRAPWRTTPLAYDWNGDGLCDLIMLDHEGILCLYPRARRSGRLVLLPPQRVFVDGKGAPLLLNGRKNGGSGRRKMSICDWNGDGRPDILINSCNAHVLLNEGEKDGKWRLCLQGPLGRRVLAGHPCAPTKVDFDNNGIPDLLVGAEDGYFYYLRNPRASRKDAAGE